MQSVSNRCVADIGMMPIYFTEPGAGTGNCVTFTNFSSETMDCVIYGTVGAGSVNSDVTLADGSVSGSTQVATLIQGILVTSRFN